MESYDVRVWHRSFLYSAMLHCTRDADDENADLSIILDAFARHTRPQPRN